jgi:RND family efflux transporter MFP subunit
MSNGFTRRRVAGALVVLLVAGGLAGTIARQVSRKAAQDKASAPLPAVALQFTSADLTHVEAKPLSRWLHVSGTLQPVRQAIVKAKVAGEVREVTVREGDSVRAGQVLARLDTADLESRLADRAGALQSARAQLALADKTRAMNLRLLHDRFISQNAFDGTESSFSVAQGNVKSAEAQVQLARNALNDALARSPLSGSVARRHVQPGEKVPMEAPLVTVVDLSDLEVQALVPAVDVPELSIGMPVSFSVDGFGERRFTGRIQRINPSTEPGTRAILVYVSLPNSDASLRGGMFATGRVALAASTPAPSLPMSAVRSEAGQSYVWVIEHDRLVKRVVLTGRRDETTGRIEIRTDLGTAPVLAARFDNLKDGAAARVKGSASTRDATIVKPTGSG